VRTAANVIAVERGALKPRVSCFPSRVGFSERDLAHLWEGQRFPAEALRTVDGQTLRVIYRGRPAGGPGPDFRDAIIAAPWGLLQGDVELHVRSSDFRRHGHQRDPAYDGLALHLVFRHDEDDNTLLASGRRAPVVALADWVEGRAQDISRWLARPLQWQEPCRSAVARLGPEAVGEALDRLGTMRFRQKVAECGRRLPSEPLEELLWEGILEALGYGGQRQAFRLLARRLPWAQLRSSVLSLPARERAAPARRLLLDAMEEAPRQPAAQRPANRPQRRLEGAAALAARFASPGLERSLLPLLNGSPKQAARAAGAALTVPGLIGPGRAQEMLANALLPCAAASGDEALAWLAEAVYRQLPLPARYGAVRHLHQALGGAVPVNASRQQGMLYLLKQYCTQGGCGRCPLS